VARFLHHDAVSNDNGESDGAKCLELPCSGQQLEIVKISFTRKGTLYRVTCGPLSDTEFAQLARASRTGEAVRLVFPQSVVTLSGITLESPEPGWAQLEGFVVDGSPAPQDSARVADRNAQIQS
jgi:hypothetical protein